MIVTGIDFDTVVPVVSLLIYRDESMTEVLLGVRRPSSTSPRHPDVLSTPTMRIPLPFMTELLSVEESRAVAMTAPHFEALQGGRSWNIGVPYSLASPQAFVAESLICRKLFPAVELVDGRFAARLWQSAVAYDVIHDDEGGYENTLMLTMSCVLASRPGRSPSGTPSYSRLDWVDTSLVDLAVTSRDPILLLPDASPLEVCIHGLCVRSAAFAIGYDSQLG